MVMKAGRRAVLWTCEINAWHSQDTESLMNTVVHQSLHFTYRWWLLRSTFTARFQSNPCILTLWHKTTELIRSFEFCSDPRIAVQELWTLYHWVYIQCQQSQHVQFHALDSPSVQISEHSLKVSFQAFLKIKELGKVFVWWNRISTISVKKQKKQFTWRRWQRTAPDPW